MKTISESVDGRRIGVSVVRAGSTEKQRGGKSARREAALRYLNAYCRHCSLVGFKYLAESNRTWIERALWIVVHAVTLCTMGFIVRAAYAEYETTPMLTTLQTDNHPVDLLEFPGVAICSVNRISRRSALEMAGEVANVSGLALDEILALIAQLGSLHEAAITVDTGSESGELDGLLRRFYNGDYDVTGILRRLAPQCSEMLLLCRFNGEERNCADVFALRKTQHGFCCTFNYAREPDDMPTLPETMEKVEAERVRDLGVERGLTVVMEPFLDDYLYTILPIEGWKVIVFNPRDYPDDTSGGVTEILVPPLTETFLELDAVTFHSTRSVKAYPVGKRACLFNDEGPHWHADYSYSDCLVDCRVDEMWDYCRCRPFFFPRRGHDEYSARTCTTADARCLSKYKTKWWSVLPHDDVDETVIADEGANASWTLRCRGCYPSCEDASYVVRSSSSYMERGRYKTDLFYNVTVADQSVLHAFFTRYATKRLKQDVAYRWYELLSNIGGICGVFVGFSLISVAEIAYYSALLLVELCGGRVRRRAARPVRVELGNNEPTPRLIYWSELMPRARGTGARSRRRERAHQ